MHWNLNFHNANSCFRENFGLNFCINDGDFVNIIYYVKMKIDDDDCGVNFNFVTQKNDDIIIMNSDVVCFNINLNLVIVIMLNCLGSYIKN